MIYFPLYPVFLQVFTSRLIENKAWINLFTALIQRISFEDLGSLRTIHPVRWISHCLVASNFFKMVWILLAKSRGNQDL